MTFGASPAPERRRGSTRPVFLLPHIEPVSSQELGWVPSATFPHKQDATPNSENNTAAA